MTKAIVIISFLLLVGCGSEAQSTTAPPPGVFVDATAEQWFSDRFEETQACTGIEAGNYDELTIVFMPPQFRCPHYKTGCNGEYVAPSTVKIDSMSVYRHEIIHYLLDQVGDSDPGHTSKFFGRCG